jgi:hypothetical protein
MERRLDMKRNTLTLAVVAASFATGVFSLHAQAASLNWDAFVIRDATASPHDAPPITENVDGAGVTTSITESGQKTGYGTTGVDGMTVGSLVTLSYDRIDSGSGVPYLNIWVTDGTNFALIAPVSDGYTNGGYALPNDINGLNLQTLGFNIYDNSDGNDYDWLVPGAVRYNAVGGPGSLLQSNGDIVTLADIASLKIGEPSTTVADSGAPQNGDGLNLVFGDTQGNFNQPIPYEIDNLKLSTVPLPASAWSGLALLGGLGLFGAVKRHRKQMV